MGHLHQPLTIFEEKTLFNTLCLNLSFIDVLIELLIDLLSK